MHRKCKKQDENASKRRLPCWVQPTGIDKAFCSWRTGKNSPSAMTQAANHLQVPLVSIQSIAVQETGLSLRTVWSDSCHDCLMGHPAEMAFPGFSADTVHITVTTGLWGITSVSTNSLLRGFAAKWLFWEIVGHFQESPPLAGHPPTSSSLGKNLPC